MFALMTWKALKIRNKYKKYVREKKNSIRKYYGKKTKYSIGDRFNHLCIDFKLCLVRCTYLRGTCLHKFCVRLRHDGTFENYVLKSIVGFISGVLITYLFFMFFVFTLNFNIKTATTMCSVFGSLLAIGLAFSQNMMNILIRYQYIIYEDVYNRCIVLMTIPQFFSQRGRQVLLAYAFILTLTGPGKNTLLNMGIMSESLACGQEQLRKAGNQVVEMVKKPYYAIRDAIKTVVKNVKEVVNKIKEIFLTIKRIVMSIVRVIKSAFEFLGKIFNICSKKIGTPFERCTRVFDTAITDCQAKLGPFFSWLCSITYVIKSVCYIVKPLDFICMLIDYVNESIIGVIMKKVRSFVRHLRTLFYVRILFSHSFQFETTHSKNMDEITEGIITEIKERCRSLLTVFDFMSAAMSFFFTVVIIKAVYYRYKFLTSEKYDNRYITRQIREIDFRRAQQQKETIFPLNHREHKIYVEPSSLRLIKIERKRLSRALTLLIVHSFKIFTYIVIDYAIYWVLEMIRYYGSFKTTIETPRVPGLYISGKGFLADLYKSIVSAFSSFGIKMDVDTIPCLPEPFPPDFYRYYQIGFLLLLCWVLAFFEPFGLRMRQAVMSYYNPVRARERAIWLFNNILRKRQNFLKFARRQLRRKLIYDKTVTNIGCMDWIRSKINNPFLLVCLGEKKQVACLLCGKIFQPNDSEKPIFCWRPGCPGKYCQNCFKELKNKCTVCLQPIDYGDLSDMDEELDSSDDENKENYKKKETEKEKKKLKKLFKIKEDVDVDDEDDSSSDTYDHNDSDTTKNKPKTGYKSTNPKSKQMRSRGGYDFYNKNDDVTAENIYSYDYQYGETDPLPEIPQRKPFYDLENQSIPDYVSMQIFIDDFDVSNKEKNYTELESDSVASTVVKFQSKHYHDHENFPEVKFYVRFNKFHAVIKYIKSFFYKKQKSESELPLIDRQNGSVKSDDDDDDATVNQSETSFIETPSDFKTDRSDNSKTMPQYKSDLNENSELLLDTQYSTPKGCYPRISKIKHFLGNISESSEPLLSSDQPCTSSNIKYKKKKTPESKRMKRKSTGYDTDIHNEFSLRKYYDSEEDKLLPKIQSTDTKSQNLDLFYNVSYREENESPRMMHHESTGETSRTIKKCDNNERKVSRIEKNEMDDEENFKISSCSSHEFQLRNLSVNSSNRSFGSSSLHSSIEVRKRTKRYYKEIIGKDTPYYCRKRKNFWSKIKDIFSTSF